MNLKVRLALLNFLEFAVWGAYLTSMGTYLGNIGMASQIGWFYAVQGVVSIFMPALMGIVADRWVPAQRLLGFCHLMAALFMFGAAYMGMTGNLGMVFWIYTLSVAFYMPTLALTNSVAYNALTLAGMDTVKDFPPIRVFGTVGFICMMWFVDLMGFQPNQNQFIASGVVSCILFLYTFTLPACPVSAKGETKSFVDAFGLRAFSLFKEKRMAIFFIFSMLLGVSLQITNGFANPFITSFGADPQYAGYLWCEPCQYPYFALSDQRDVLYPADTVLHESLWYQECDADSHVCLGIAIRSLRSRKSRQWRMDVYPFHVGLWCGFRLLQRFRLSVC